MESKGKNSRGFLKPQTMPVESRNKKPSLEPRNAFMWKAVSPFRWACTIWLANSWLCGSTTCFLYCSRAELIELFNMVL